MTPVLQHRFLEQSEQEPNEAAISVEKRKLVVMPMATNLVQTVPMSIWSAPFWLNKRNGVRQLGKW